jgi:hypothetical protein
MSITFSIGTRLSSVPMDFEIAHSFPHDVDEVAAAILDEKYQASLSDVESLREREVLLQE